jgi:hypothetical protein
MMLDYPKRIKRAIRELAAVAYEEEMKRELGQLAQGFDAWRAGTIDLWELHRRIHKYHDGPARQLYNTYNESHQDMLVAYAIVRGVISEERVPAELWQYLERPLAFYRSMEQRGRAGASAAEDGDEGG